MSGHPDIKFLETILSLKPALPHQIFPKQVRYQVKYLKKFQMTSDWYHIGQLQSVLRQVHSPLSVELKFLLHEILQVRLFVLEAMEQRCN